MPKKSLYFDSYCGYTISVILENGKLTEFNFEKSSTDCAVGNIYKGRVERVLPGLQAAFVNCGLERNCYLSSNEPLPDSDNYEVGSAADLVSPLKEGDEILVQITKPPVGTKGAKVTAHPSLIGKTLIYLPDTPFIGVSRKIADGELRQNLAYSAMKIKTEDEGLVLRTAAPYVKLNQLKDEYTYLKNLYNEMLEAFEKGEVGDLLYTDVALPIKVLRDTLSTDIDEIVVGSESLKDLIERIVALYPSQTKKTVKLHATGRDMLDELGITAQINSVFAPRVDLDNGAYLIIENTEALTVIDVNTGSFTGDYNLEQTVYYTNILAAREIARQVKLRNIGGIVVVDFIDMANPAHNAALVEELKRALKGDKAKCSVAPMSKFGLVEFTRRRIGVSSLTLTTKPCRYCGSAGYVLSGEYVLLSMRAKLLNLIAGGKKRIRLDMNRDVHTLLLNSPPILEDLKKYGSEIYAVPHRTFHEHQIIYRTDEFEIPDDGVKIV